jgi:hypothetical protein
MLLDYASKLLEQRNALTKGPRHRGSRPEQSGIGRAVIVPHCHIVRGVDRQVQTTAIETICDDGTVPLALVIVHVWPIGCVDTDTA